MERNIEKIAKALHIKVSDLLIAEDIFKDVNSLDKTLVEKVQLIEQLDDNEKKSIFSIIDGLASKKKMKDSLTKLSRNKKPSARAGFLS